LTFFGRRRADVYHTSGARNVHPPSAWSLKPPPDPPSPFDLDPEIKFETIFAAPSFRPSGGLVDRPNALVRIRSDAGEWSILTSSLQNFDSMLSELNYPKRAPEITAIRDTVRSWRFYDHFRVRPYAPARQPIMATRYWSSAYSHLFVPNHAAGNHERCARIGARDRGVFGRVSCASWPETTSQKNN
jgi:predicted ATPase